jgi:hypothetical protein
MPYTVLNEQYSSFFRSRREIKRQQLGLRGLPMRSSILRSRGFERINARGQLFDLRSFKSRDDDHAPRARTVSGAPTQTPNATIHSASG